MGSLLPWGKSLARGRFTPALSLKLLQPPANSGDGLFLKNLDTGETVCFPHEDKHRLDHRPEQLTAMEDLDDSIHQLDFLSLAFSTGDYLELSPEVLFGLCSSMHSIQGRLGRHQYCSRSEG
ncbi:hypothetical protein [Microbulbifer discodermiae]